MVNKKDKKIFVFSSVHPWNDGRIFFRQVQTLSEHFTVELHAVADFKFKKVNDVNVYGIPKWQNLLDRIKAIWILWTRIFRSQCDVYHFHDPELLLLAPFIKIIKRKPLIFDVHEHYPFMIGDKKYIPWFLRKLTVLLYVLFERFALLFVDRVFYTTKIVGKRYIAFKGRYAVQVSNVPSIKLFEKPPPPFEERDKRAVFLGGITEVRGIKEIINAFNIVHQKDQEYELWLVGPFISEKFKGEIENLIEKLGLENVIHIKKPIPYNEIYQLLYNSQIGYITYLSYPNNMACLPNKIFEYMGAGMAIIASDFENYRDVLVDHSCGLTVEPEDYAAIARQTLRYIEDPEFSRQMSSRARELYETKFNWENESKGFVKAYQELLSI